MPLYEYECTQCKRHTEKIQKFSDAEITQCPHCGGLLERVVSAPAISFKGGGWYADGYGNAKPAAAKSEASESKSDTKSDSGTTNAAASAEPTSKSKDPASTPSATPSTATPAAPSSAPTSSDKK